MDGVIVSFDVLGSVINAQRQEIAQLKAQIEMLMNQQPMNITETRQPPISAEEVERLRNE